MGGWGVAMEIAVIGGGQPMTMGKNTSNSVHNTQNGEMRKRAAEETNGGGEWD